MAAVKRRSERLPARIAAYAILTAFGLMMAFPFIYAVAASFKEGSDIFRDPPTVLPRKQNTTTIDGKVVPLFKVKVPGEGKKTYGLVEAGIDIALLAPVDSSGKETGPRIERKPLELTPVGGYSAPKKIKLATGEEVGVFNVSVGGKDVELAQVGKTIRGRFSDPNKKLPDVIANPRLATRDESLYFRTQNYTEVRKLQNIDQSLWNTSLVTLLVVIGTVVTSVMGGYAFSRIQFRGRDAIFAVYLGSIMIPFVLLIIPLFKLMVWMGWNNHLSSLVFPFIFSAYGTFLMRQFFLTIPKDLDEAATIDGASQMQVLWKVLVPLSWPAVATLSTFTFLYAWNSFIWPLVSVSANEKLHVLTISLSQLGGRAADKPQLVFAAVALAVTVPILVFILAQRYFVESQTSSAVK